MVDEGLTHILPISTSIYFQRNRYQCLHYHDYRSRDFLQRQLMQDEYIYLIPFFKLISIFLIFSSCPICKLYLPLIISQYSILSGNLVSPFSSVACPLWPLYHPAPDCIFFWYDGDFLRRHLLTFFLLGWTQLFCGPVFSFYDLFSCFSGATAIITCMEGSFKSFYWLLNVSYSILKLD